MAPLLFREGRPIFIDRFPVFDQLFAVEAVVVLLEHRGQECDCVRRSILVGGDDILFTSLEFPVPITVDELSVRVVGSVILKTLGVD